MVELSFDEIMNIVTAISLTIKSPSITMEPETIQSLLNTKEKLFQAAVDLKVKQILSA